ncbi:hypothetical protein RvY_12357 [Ramazzottius varieornatus]|uniref:Uncharacterized protein n=1 Tax=Ramazzottius varieornatus TaxID=947166 RepID=A0A1D1VRW0_RAMVA|nr:hypothetical protein RvY_12357 [Ramazzottius varieornatus]
MKRAVPAEVMPTDPKEFYEKRFFVPFITELIALYKFRFGKNSRDFSRIALLIPSQVLALSSNMEQFEDTFVFYKDDVNSITFGKFVGQLQQWQNHWIAEKVKETRFPKTASKTLKYFISNLYTERFSDVYSFM